MRTGSEEVAGLGGRALIAGTILMILFGSEAFGTETAARLPDGVCYPVQGSGFILNGQEQGDTLRIGPLTPVYGGNLLVVESGSITFLDFRNGQSSVLGPGSRHIVPKGVIDPDRPTAWAELKERLRRLFRDAQRSTLEEGASRSETTGIWPDEGAVFAPDVPLALEWWGITDSLTAIRIRGAGDERTIPLTAAARLEGRLAFASGDWVPGEIAWCLLDAHGEPHLCGHFTLLSAAAAELRRAQYIEQAVGDAMPRELAAALRALADRTYLW